MLGTYNPMVDPAAITLKTDRIQYWLDQGAKPSDTVRSILKKQGAA
jgi:small subunit ribosomal protein S16